MSEDSPVDRHSRQARLSDVGPDGQRRIARAVVSVPCGGLAAEIAARYLAGAGVLSLRVGNEATAAAARAVSGAATVEVDACLSERVASRDATQAALASFVDPAAREVAEGAWFALQALRSALGSDAS